MLFQSIVFFLGKVKIHALCLILMFFPVVLPSHPLFCNKLILLLLEGNWLILHLCLNMR